MSAGHDHRHHEHASDRRRLTIALALTGSFMFAELIGGWLANSLALLADAAHMLTDTLALAMALVAAEISQRPPDPRRSYGHARWQVLAAFANGVLLLALAAWIVVEAALRLTAPPVVDAPLMMTIAAAGLLVNMIAFAVLHGGQRNINIRAASLHVLGDLLGSVAALAAGVAILTTGWLAADPLLSVVVAALIGRSAWRITADAGHVLLEGTPARIDVAALSDDLVAAIPDVADVHHVHAWSLTEQNDLITLHARLRSGAHADRVLAAIKDRLATRYGIHHSTIQLEAGDCADDETAGCAEASDEHPPH
jgi:cobalt-zinc-cadmium efflux system protein